MNGIGDQPSLQTRAYLDKTLQPRTTRREKEASVFANGPVFLLVH